METSFQAQLVIPMATSLCFGLILSTVLVLVLVPTFYTIYGQLFGIRIHHEEAESEKPSDKLASAAIH